MLVRLGNRLLVAVVAAAAVAVSPSPAAEKPALSAKIDAIIQARLEKEKVPPSPPADDAAFLRRAYLDITGSVPTAEQARAYLDDTDPGKRRKLVDALLASPGYGEHFGNVWRDLIVDRGEDQKRVRERFAPALHAWLVEGFNKGRGWDATVYDMLTAEGEVKNNPAGVFTLACEVNDFPRPEVLAGTAGRLFMGLHIRCAQCHNHPYVEEWKQDDFWGVAAFFGQVRDTGLPVNGPTINPVLSEKPNPDEKAETRYGKRMVINGQIPALKGAKIAIPTTADPTKTQREVRTKFFLSAETVPAGDGPYRPIFAKWLVSKENPYFAKATVNRIWSQFFARGIVSPVDDLGPAHEPTHPELLDLLTAEFKASNFDYREMVRAICCTDAYARSSKPLPENAADKELYSHMAIKVLSPDQTVDAFLAVTNRKALGRQPREKMAAVFATKEADDPATDYSHGIPQFLYQMNGQLNGIPLPGGLAASTDSASAVTTLYLTVLSRRPTPDELKRMTAYVGKADKPADAYKDIFWVLLNSAEFILNR